MKILTLKINDQKYMSGKINTYMTKEAMKIQKAALDLGGKAKSIEHAELEEATELMEALIELSDRKTWLICEVFENKFTPDALDQNLSSEEIDATINMIIGAASGVIEKN
jgi:hypothetical protein